VFAAANSSLSVSLSADQTAWLATTAVRLRVVDPTGQTLGQPVTATKNDSGREVQLRVETRSTGFYGLLLEALSTPPQNKSPAYNLRVSYRAPQRN